MGHDITAIKNIYEYVEFWENIHLDQDEKIEEFKRRSEIAYLRRSMSNTSIRTFYLYLNCKEFDSGVSGSGEHVWIDLERLNSALNKFEMNRTMFMVGDDKGLKEDYVDFTNFIQTCINFCKRQNKLGVMIHFG